MNKSLTFRLMNEEDIDDVLEIEHKSFATPGAGRPFLTN